MPGRTDNEIKNFWRTHFKKKEKSSRKQQKRRSQLLTEQKLQKAHHVDLDHDHQQLPQMEAMNGSDQTTTSNDHDQAPREAIKHENMVLNNPSLDQNTVAAGARDININGSHNNQNSLPAVMFQDDTISYSWSNTTADQDYYGLWGGLWNLDDQPYGHTNNNNNNQASTAGNYCYYAGDYINHSNKNIIPIQNQARAFSSYGEYCIF